MQYRTKQGDRLDRLCAQHYGHQTGTVEAVLQANPGLAAYGPVFDAGLLITLPATPAPTATNSVRLWE